MESASNLGYLIHHLAFTLDRCSDQVLQERIGLSFSKFKVLMALKWLGHGAQREIADYLGQTEASISRQVKLMKVLGLIDVTPNPKSRRQRMITLSVKGEKVSERATTILNEYHLPTFSEVPEKQLNQLNETLLKMHERSCTLGARCPIR